MAKVIDAPDNRSDRVCNACWSDYHAACARKANAEWTCTCERCW